MKYAITGPKGRIIRVVDHQFPDQTLTELTDDQAALVQSATPPDFYAIVNGEFITSQQFKQIRDEELKARMNRHLTTDQIEANERSKKIADAYKAAAAVFESLPLGKQALWEPVRSAVAFAIKTADFAKAREILETTPAIYEGAEVDRQTFLNLLTQ